MAKTTVICKKEHKLHGTKLIQTQNMLWLRVNFFYKKINITYNHMNNEVGVESKEIKIFIYPFILQLVTLFGYF